MTDINMTIDAPTHVTSLATSAILVSVEVTASTGTKRSHELGSELSASKQADDDASEVNKKLFAGCREHQALSKFRASIGNGMRVFTFPWAGSMNLLPMNRYTKFMDWYDLKKDEHTALKKAFIDAYPDLIANAPFKMGTMYNRADFPSVDDMEKCFTMSLYQSEVPTGDFRVQIAHDLANDLHTHYTNKSRELVGSIYEAQTEQFAKVMQSIHHCCGFETKTNKAGDTVMVRRKLYDSTIHKALEMCDTFAQFNPSGNSKLEEARLALQAVLSNVDAERLRESDTMRIKIGEEVGDILNKFRL